VSLGKRRFLSGFGEAIPGLADQFETFGDTRSIDAEST